MLLRHRSQCIKIPLLHLLRFLVLLNIVTPNSNSILRKFLRIYNIFNSFLIPILKHSRNNTTRNQKTQTQNNSQKFHKNLQIFRKMTLLFHFNLLLNHNLALLIPFLFILLSMLTTTIIIITCFFDVFASIHINLSCSFNFVSFADSQRQVSSQQFGRDLMQLRNNLDG